MQSPPSSSSSMATCGSCGEQQPAELLSPHGLNKCSKCVATPSSPSSTPPTPTPTKKTCSMCKQSNKVFSQAQQAREDGMCVSCTEKASPSSFWAKTDQPSTPQAATKNGEEADDGDVEIRQHCISCNVFKPTLCFETSSASFCRVCAEAKKNHKQSTTMKDHGFVRGDGTSHRRLNIVPDTLVEYLAYYARVQQEQQGEGEEGEHEYDEDDEEREQYEEEYDYA